MSKAEPAYVPSVRLEPPHDAHAQLQVAGLTIPVTIHHERRRDARASIGRRGLVIRVPATRATAWCEQQVTALLRWAARTIDRDPQRFRIRPPRRYRDGQRLTITGAAFGLHLETADRATNAVRLGAVDAAGCQAIRITLSSRQSAAQRDHALPRLVSRGLALAKEPELRRQVAALNARYFRRPLGKVRYRYARSRWGSCSARGDISIATRLLLAPPAVFRYVLIHELAHLVELNHSPRFWNLVASADPGYREHQAWLHRHQEDCQF